MEKKKSNLRKYDVYCIKKAKTGNPMWFPAGRAIENRDGSINLYLDFVPTNGEVRLVVDDSQVPGPKVAS